MKLKIYQFVRARNKCSLKGNSVKCVKKDLINKNGRNCYLCNKLFERDSQLELEHKIPVFVDGKIFDKDNLNLVCIKCHNKKTLIDKKVINSMKKMGIIFGRNYADYSFFSLEELKKLYLQFSKIINDCQDNYTTYNNGESNIDYEVISDYSNRDTT